MSRLNDRRKGISVVVMHRLHKDELSSSHLINNHSKRWKHLCLPILNESRHKIYSIAKHKLLFIRQSMTPLSTKHHSLKEIEEIKLEIGSYAFASQYQQSPIYSHQNIIKNSFFKRHHNLDHLINNDDKMMIKIVV